MAQTDYKVEGRHFRTKSDYARALHDKQIMDRLRKETDLTDRKQLEKLKGDLRSGKYKFFTPLGQDFAEEVDSYIKELSGRSSRKLDSYAREELKRQEKRRKIIILVCSLVALVCLGYVGVYSYFNKRTADTYEALGNMRDDPQAYAGAAPAPTAQYTLDGEQAPREILDKYKNLVNVNKKLIGWLSIDDTNIDYPVMQTDDNEYYLNHNMNQEYDKNGSIFMDKDCDIAKPSMNFILYGHHMRSGMMSVHRI